MEIDLATKCRDIMRSKLDLANYVPSQRVLDRRKEIEAAIISSANNGCSRIRTSINNQFSILETVSILDYFKCEGFNVVGYDVVLLQNGGPVYWDYEISWL